MLHLLTYLLLAIDFLAQLLRLSDLGRDGVPDDAVVILPLAALGRFVAVSFDEQLAAVVRAVVRQWDRLVGQ